MKKQYGIGTIEKKPEPTTYSMMADEEKIVPITTAGRGCGGPYTTKGRDKDSYENNDFMEKFKTLYVTQQQKTNKITIGLRNLIGSSNGFDYSAKYYCNGNLFLYGCDAKNADSIKADKMLYFKELGKEGWNQVSDNMKLAQKMCFSMYKHYLYMFGGYYVDSAGKTTKNGGMAVFDVDSETITYLPNKILPHYVESKNPAEDKDNAYFLTPAGEFFYFTYSTAAFTDLTSSLSQKFKIGKHTAEYVKDNFFYCIDADNNRRVKIDINTGAVEIKEGINSKAANAIWGAIHTHQCAYCAVPEEQTSYIYKYDFDLDDLGAPLQSMPYIYDRKDIEVISGWNDILIFSPAKYSDKCVGYHPQSDPDFWSVGFSRDMLIINGGVTSRPYPVKSIGGDSVLYIPMQKANWEVIEEAFKNMHGGSALSEPLTPDGTTNNYEQAIILCDGKPILSLDILSGTSFNKKFTYIDEKGSPMDVELSTIYNSKGKAMKIYVDVINF